jgi:hypothetical protein
MAVLDHLDTPDTPDRPPRADRVRRAATIGLMVWLAAVVASMVWAHFWPLDRLADISAAPFYGHWQWLPRGWMVAAVAVGITCALGLPRLFAAVGGRWVAPLAGGAGVVWAVTLAATDGGLHRLASPLESKHDVYPLAVRIDPSSFLRTFVARAQHYPTHVKGHPPGLVLVFWALDRLGLHGPGWAAVLVLAMWGVGVASVVWTMGRVGGSSAGRRVASFVALAPAVVWAATSVDALIAGVTALGIALVVAGTGTGETTPSPWPDDLVAVAGGLVLGAALYLSYGVVPLLLVPVAVAVWRRRARPLVVAAVGMLVVVAAFSAAGFWWLDGLSATRGFYLEGLARVRPYWYFVLAGNLGALALAIGPAAGAGLGRLVGEARRRPELVVIGAVFVAMVAADVSGMSKAEVERIWLPYSLWLAAAGGAAVASGRPRRGRLPVGSVEMWLGAQVALALALQVWLVTPW